MITKTYEVTITKRIRVNLPDSYATEESIAGWREGLWEIDGVDDIAQYAAILAASGEAECNNDGVGVMMTESVAAYRSQPGYPLKDRQPNEFTVTYAELSEELEAIEVAE